MSTGNCNGCNGCNRYNGYNENYEGAYYGDEAAYAREDSFYRGGNCSGNAAAASNRSGCGCCRNCDLYWKGYMAGYYSNNCCNQTAVTRTAAQASEWTAAAAANYGCSCNTRNNCDRGNSCNQR